MSNPATTVNAKQEIVALFETYIDAFNLGDFAACVACYRLPFTFITDRGISVLQDEASFLSMWRDNHAQLQAKGWSHSRALRTGVHLLDENLALLSVLVARYRADRSQDELLAGLYNVRKGREGWKLVTATSHPAQTCLALS